MSTASEVHKDGSGKEGSGHGDRPPAEKLHIFVNRRKFDAEQGVRPIMTAAQIAALVEVPANLAVVRRGDSGDSPELPLNEPLQIHQAEHFLVTRRTVEGGSGPALTTEPVAPPRIQRELDELALGGQEAVYIPPTTPGGRAFVIYRAVPTAGAPHGLPATSDVIVPVSSGYPAAMIDLAGLPVGSPFIARVKGGSNNQGIIEVDGQHWQLASYHPHNNGGGPVWDQCKHGFHTYFDELVAWLASLA